MGSEEEMVRSNSHSGEEGSGRHGVLWVVGPLSGVHGRNAGENDTILELFVGELEKL